MEVTKVKIFITGTVQGVGFRPFIYNLATELGLVGWVKNNTEGVRIEAEGSKAQLQKFLNLIPQQKPLLAEIEDLRFVFDKWTGFKSFSIQESDTALREDAVALVLPDTATCDQCLNDILDPTNRRHLYPFTTCTLCGPRYSISEMLPFDRVHTSMKLFPMCSDCQKEFENFGDRRFFSQTNSCPDCGPQLSFLDKQGNEVSKSNKALEQACEEIKKGSIVGIKGIGGFHLFGDARNESTLDKLRYRKKRLSKPFAVMMPSLQEAEKYCYLNEVEKTSLHSPVSPILLLQKRPEVQMGSYKLSPQLAPGLGILGVMLPYTPLHHLVVDNLNFPLVATSANIPDEPICTDESKDFSRLSELADFILTHNRPIRNSMDDAIVRIIDNKPVVFRTGRGNSPGNFKQSQSAASEKVAIAMGGQMKNTIALSTGNKIYLSQHNGSLDTFESVQKFKSQCENLPAYYQCKPAIAVHDQHPRYASSVYANQLAHDKNWALASVQHHQAHILSCVAEHNPSFPLLGVCWDGTGHGLDGTIWGGEFLFMQSASNFERFACIRPFHLPGGDRAILEPRRSALGILCDFKFDLDGIQSSWAKNNFLQVELFNLKKMLDQKINSPLCSSAGRLFDAVASLLEVCHISNYEGEAAMKLESLAYQWIHKSDLNLSTHSDLENLLSKIPYPQKLIKELPTNKENGKESMTPAHWIDGEEIIKIILQNVEMNKETSYIAFLFHFLLAKAIDEMVTLSAVKTIVLSGGVFQNKLLSELTLSFLRRAGLQPFTNRNVPPNDGGLSVGQAYFFNCSEPPPLAPSMKDG